ncbi:MAG: polyprenyl synthetase family protein [Myxococcota bacterium]
MTEDSSLRSVYGAPARKPRRAIEPLRRTSERMGLGRLANRLAEVQGWLADDLIAMEREIVVLTERREDDDLARQAASHLLRRPGKRIRPICVLLGAQLAGVAIDEGMRRVAVACELVHAATLLHDDVIDEGTERRGEVASRMVYGNSASILAGDYLLIEALQRVAPVGDPLLMSTLLQTIERMVAAEAVQLEQRGTLHPSRERYLEVIEGKTASLFQWALSAATLSRGDDEAPMLDALAQAGRALGMAFQLVDDVLDLEGEPETTGKNLFADLLQGKVTWPLIVAAEQDPGVVAALHALSENVGGSARDLIARIRATDAIPATRAFVEEQRQLALDGLSELPPSRALDAIVAVVEAAVNRQK